MERIEAKKEKHKNLGQSSKPLTQNIMANVEKLSSTNRDWLDLPEEVTASILSRLGAVQILTAAEKVCTAWRKISKEPSTWRTIDMSNNTGHDFPEDTLEKMCRHAIDRSRGNLVGINVEYLGTKEFLKHITDSSSSGITGLRLAYCGRDGSRGLIFKEALKLPRLEDLEIIIHFPYITLSAQSVQVIGRSCPLLKSFRLKRMWYDIFDQSSFKWRDEYATAITETIRWHEVFDQLSYKWRDENATAIAETMPGLSHLQLWGNELTNDGLRKILDSCPHLEWLDVRQCRFLDLEGDLGRECAQRIKHLLLPNDFISHSELKAGGYHRSDLLWFR